MITKNEDVHAVSLKFLRYKNSKMTGNGEVRAHIIVVQEEPCWAIEAGYFRNDTIVGNSWSPVFVRYIFDKFTPIWSGRIDESKSTFEPLPEKPCITFPVFVASIPIKSHPLNVDG